MATPAPSEKREILACAADGVRARRQAEVDDLARLLAWADAHSGDPQAEPWAVPVRYGGSRRWGRGRPRSPRPRGWESHTPRLRSLSAIRWRWASGSAVGGAGPTRPRSRSGWRHRDGPPGQTGDHNDPWVARKVSSLSRKLSREAVKQVDAAVTAVVEASPYRILAAAEAAIELDWAE